MEKISASKLLAGLVPADFIREEVQVELVTTDSREVRPGCIFVAFPGEKFDGHDSVSYTHLTLPTILRV